MAGRGHRRTGAGIAAALLLAAARPLAWSQADPGPPDPPEPITDAWTFSAAAMGYFVPDAPDYAQPTITADRGWLHLEARYNYEALETGSAWAGYNLGGGEILAWEITPMVGGVFGDTTGLAPGYKGALSWWRLELYSEGEYVVDLEDSSGHFFYSWSELTFSPVDGFHFGLVTQRTRVYEAEREIQRGLLIGFTYQRVDVTTCLFDLDTSRPTAVIGVALAF
jgi:hypothetical protein